MTDREDDYERTEHRRFPRVTVEEKLRAVLTTKDGTEVEAEVRDISAGGAGLILGTSFYNETFVDLHMENFGKVNIRVARQFREGIGIEFNVSDKEREALKEELAKFRKAGGRGSF